jgi:hypothetical protein
MPQILLFSAWCAPQFGCFLVDFVETAYSMPQILTISACSVPQF